MSNHFADSRNRTAQLVPKVAVESEPSAVRAFRLELKTRVDRRSLVEIALGLGYTTRCLSKSIARIESVVSDPFLGLTAKGGYDFRYDGRAFILAIAAFVDLQATEAERAVEMIQRMSHQRMFGFRRRLIARTDFRRKSQPIFTLALLERLKIVALPQEVELFEGVSDGSEIAIVIQSHFAATEGKLKFWGNVVGYSLEWSKGKFLHFKVDGQIISEDDVLGLTSTVTSFGDQLLIVEHSE